jgi:hypothetical protein
VLRFDVRDAGFAVLIGAGADGFEALPEDFDRLPVKRENRLEFEQCGPAETLTDSKRHHRSRFEKRALERRQSWPFRQRGPEFWPRLHRVVFSDAGMESLQLLIPGESM